MTGSLAAYQEMLKNRDYEDGIKVDVQQSALVMPYLMSKRLKRDFHAREGTTSLTQTSSRLPRCLITAQYRMRAWHTCSC